MQTILGPGNTETWCYFYEKAELARQFKQWDKVAQLWSAASQRGLKPAHGLEYLAFIEASGLLGDWKTARELTQAANKTSQSMESALCPLWQALAQSAPPSTEREAALQNMNKYLECAP